VFKLFLTLLVAFLVSGIGSCNEEKQHTGRVVKVRDGDSLLLEVAKKKVEVRLFGIDAPELNQPGGKSARDFLAGLVVGKKVTIKKMDMDRYGRVVALLYTTPHESLNERLLAGGYAWWYRKTANHYGNFESAYKKAKASKLGIWRFNNNELIPPWEWRSRYTEARGTYRR
jgi:endonuclease YncB( thermonuclease family)